MPDAMMRAETSTLLLIDFQAKLMPAIDQAAATVANARRLIDAAGLVGRSRDIFGVALLANAVMSSAFLRGEWDPSALMLSADPLPLSDRRA
jgi:hypothetical protein